MVSCHFKTLRLPVKHRRHTSKMGVVLRKTSLGAYHDEELLQIIIVIPENIRFFQPNLDIPRQCGCQKPYARFLASFCMYLGSGKKPKIKNVKFLTHGPSM